MHEPCPVSRRRSSQSGIALLLTLLIFLILAAIVSELMISTRLDYEVSKNDANMARLDLAAESVLLDALETVVQDGQDDTSAGAAGGGLPTTEGAAGGAAGAPPGQGASDSFEDEWAKPFDKTLGDARVSVWIEDENRKFNLLALLSPDETYAKDSFERLVRILDRFREETDRDLDSSQAESLAAAIRDYMFGTNRSERIPRPALLTDLPNETKAPPLTLDELLFVEGIDADLLYDQQQNPLGSEDAGTIYPGLCSMLTVWTSLQPMPAAGGAQATEAGTTPSTTPAASAGANPATGSGAGGESSPVGVKINVNTASRALLKSLISDSDLPSEVVEGIIRFRNLEREETAEAAEEAEIQTDTLTGEEVKPREFFSSLDDLDRVPEFQNFPDQKIKDEFRKLLSVRSDVFSIHMTARLADSGEEAGAAASDWNDRTSSQDKPGKLARRVRSVFWRRQGANGSEILPVLRWEIRSDIRIVPRDFPPEEMPRR